MSDPRFNAAFRQAVVAAMRGELRKEKRDQMSGPSAKAEQKERRALVGSDTTTTYHAQALVGLALDEPGGRYRSSPTVSGAEPATLYPRLPEGNPRAGDGVGVEPPLGIDVNAMEPNGPYSEIQSSLSHGPLSEVGDAARTVSLPPVVLRSPDFSPRAASSPIRKRRIV